MCLSIDWSFEDLDLNFSFDVIVEDSFQMYFKRIQIMGRFKLK